MKFWIKVIIALVISFVNGYLLIRLCESHPGLFR